MESFFSQLVSKMNPTWISSEDGQGTETVMENYSRGLKIIPVVLNRRVEICFFAHKLSPGKFPTSSQFLKKLESPSGTGSIPFLKR
jgi:hypothetical protein